MAEGVDRPAWDRAATLWALMANVWSGKGAPVYKPRMVHPYYPDTIPGSAGNRVPLTTDNLDAFSQAIVTRYAKRK